MSLGRRFHPGKRLLALAGSFGSSAVLQLVIGTLDQLLQLKAVLQVIPLGPFRGPVTHQLLVGDAHRDYHIGPNLEVGKLVVPLHVPLHETPLPKLPPKSHDENFLNALHHRQILRSPHSFALLLHFGTSQQSHRCVPVHRIAELSKQQPLKHLRLHVCADVRWALQCTQLSCQPCRGLLQ